MTLDPHFTQRYRSLIAAALCAVGTTACSDGTAPGTVRSDATYNLCCGPVAIASSAAGTITVLSTQITLRSDGTYREQGVTRSTVGGTVHDVAGNVSGRYVQTPVTLVLKGDNGSRETFARELNGTRLRTVSSSYVSGSNVPTTSELHIYVFDLAL
ncbi:MAG: hypothetical protein ACR2GG_02680 [Gemmatimonadaceae bacterium]